MRKEIYLNYTVMRNFYYLKIIIVISIKINRNMDF